MRRIFKSAYRAFGMAITLSALALVGCDGLFPPMPTPEPEPEPTPDPTEVVLSASVEATRTTMNENGVVLWSANDQILISGSTETIFQISAGANTAEGEFKGILPASDEGEYRAGYPASMWSEGEELHTATTQKYKRGSFANNTNPMLASFNEGDTDLLFQNVFGIVMFQLTGSGTIDSIEVSNDDVQLVGEFKVNPSTLGVTAVDGLKKLSLVDVNVTLGAEPEAFYVVVPPATYNNLTITVNCTDGTTVVREAKQEVKVCRNEVLPLAPISIEAEPYQPMVSGAVNAERSHWNSVSFDITRNEMCDRAYIGWAYTSEYETIMEQNPEWTEYDLFVNWMSNKYVSGDTIDINILPNVEYTYIFLGLDAAGNFEASTITHKQAGLFLGNVGVEAGVNEMTTYSAECYFNLTGEVENIYYALFAGDVESVFDESTDLLFYNIAQSERVAVTSNPMINKYENLNAYSYYTLVVIAEGVDRSLAFDAHAFRTPAYQSGDATIDWTVAVADTYIDVNLYGDWASYKYMVLNNTTLTGDFNLSTYASVIDKSDEPFYTESSFRVNHLMAAASHVVVLLPYDSNGVYGNIVAFQVNTREPEATSDSEAYRSYIGRWVISFYDENNSYYEDCAEVNITPEFVGSTYRVSGLSLGKCYNDTLRGYFIDGKFCLIAYEAVAWPANESITAAAGRLCLITDDGYWSESGYLEGVINNGTMQFTSSVGEIDWFTIRYYDENNNPIGFYPPSMCNNTWRYIEPDSAGAVAEGFERGDAVDAGWR